MSSLSIYKPANLFIIVSKYFFPIPLLKISSVTVSADVFLYQPEFPWLNSSNIYLLTLLNADTFSFASHLSPAILHSGKCSFINWGIGSGMIIVQHLHSLLYKVRKFLKAERIHIISLCLCRSVYDDNITYR